jgi:prephenate dehydrogenase
MVFSKITILGVGLIGASFALAMREIGLCRDIVGFGRDEGRLKKAKERNIIDSYELVAGEACKGSDLIVFATPVGASLGLADRVSRSIGKGSLAIDVGSVKGRLVSEMEKIIPGFVGCHPIAGGDRSGIDHASAGLFKGALAVITKTDKTGEEGLKKAIAIWEALGSKVEIMDPFEHDRVYALVSHMPHLVAYALVNTVSDVEKSYLKFAGQGFKDTTRIAASSEVLWRDICLMNRDNILGFMNKFRENIDKLCLSLKNDDARALQRLLKNARMLREGIEQD